MEEVDYSNLIVCFFQGGLVVVPIFFAVWVVRQVRKFFTTASKIGD